MGVCSYNSVSREDLIRTLKHFFPTSGDSCVKYLLRWRSERLRGPRVGLRDLKEGIQPESESSV
jgi:hypothetical protein